MKSECRLKLAMITPETAASSAAVELHHAKMSLGMIPNLYAYMANAPGLLATYRYGYDLFRRQSDFSPVEQEVVFLTISFANDCDYCMAAHSTVADMHSRMPREVSEALRNGTVVPDARLETLREFTRIMVESRGRPVQADLERFLCAGYTEAQVLQIILAIGIKTLSNYTNHVCQTPLDAEFSGKAWRHP